MLTGSAPDNARNGCAALPSSLDILFEPDPDVND
jgi:hypothetical protein